MIKTVSGFPQLLQAENISVPHGFTTRLGGVSTGIFDSLNLGCHRGDAQENVEKNYEILGKALGFSLSHLVLARQTHSDIVRVVDERDGGKGVDHRLYPECDGLVTAVPGLALMVFTADCTPILLQDPVTGAVGAVHAGWRGTALGIVGKAVDAMVQAFGTDPRDIRAAIGPNIGPCCFETDQDVPLAMTEALGQRAKPWIHPQGDKYYVNLKQLNALWLRDRGVESIALSGACTHCQHQTFWSHRFTKGERGSQGALIVCKEG